MPDDAFSAALYGCRLACCEHVHPTCSCWCSGPGGVDVSTLSLAECCDACDVVRVWDTRAPHIFPACCNSDGYHTAARHAWLLTAVVTPMPASKVYASASALKPDSAHCTIARPRPQHWPCRLSHSQHMDTCSHSLTTTLSHEWPWSLAFHPHSSLIPLTSQTTTDVTPWPMAACLQTCRASSAAASPSFLGIARGV